MKSKPEIIEVINVSLNISNINESNEHIKYRLLLNIITIMILKIKLNLVIKYYVC